MPSDKDMRMSRSHAALSSIEHTLHRFNRRVSLTLWLADALMVLNLLNLLLGWTRDEGGPMEPQEYATLKRHLEVLRAKQLRWIADQDQTLARLQQALAVEHAIHEMDSRALLAFCADLEARYAEDGGRDA